MNEIVAYMADDGKIFETEEACISYEREIERQLIFLSEILKARAIGLFQEPPDKRGFHPGFFEFSDIIEFDKDFSDVFARTNIDALYLIKHLPLACSNLDKLLRILKEIQDQKSQLTEDLKLQEEEDLKSEMIGLGYDVDSDSDSGGHYMDGMRDLPDAFDGSPM